MGRKRSEGKRIVYRCVYRLTVSCIRVSLSISLHVFLSLLSRLHIAHNSQTSVRVDISRKREIMGRNRYNFHEFSFQLFQTYKNNI